MSFKKTGNWSRGGKYTKYNPGGSIHLLEEDQESCSELPGS